MAITVSPLEESTPLGRLTTGSVCLSSKRGHFSFKDWDAEELRSSYEQLKKLIIERRMQNFMVFGRTTQAAQFVWEWVPYPPVGHWIYVVYNQLKVLVAFALRWRQTLYSHLAVGQREVTLPNAPCAFCDETQAVVQKQRVFEGQNVNLLIDYRPLTSLHFLVVPKIHRKDFHELTEEEYSEALRVAQKVAKWVSESYLIRNSYFFHKTGKIAGQSVPHWHLHLVFTQRAEEETWGKLKVLKNILIGSSPLSPRKVEESRNSYCSLLAPVLSV